MTTRQTMAEEWVSVEERLPAERVEVLVTVVQARDKQDRFAPKVIQASLRHGKWQDGRNPLCDICWRVTHWMPLPQPAATEEAP